MKIHQLKIQKQHYDDIMSGVKTAELRFDDRDYEVGDLIFFKGLALPDGNVKPFSFKVNLPLRVFYVSHIIKNTQYLQPGYIMLSLIPVNLHWNDDAVICTCWYFNIDAEILENRELLLEFLKSVNWEHMYAS